MSSQAATPLEIDLDNARSFQDKYRRARRAAVTFLDYSAARLIETLNRSNQPGATTEKYAVRQVQIDATTTIAGNFSAWKLPDSGLCVIEGLSGLVRMETESRGRLVTCESLLDDQPIGEESAYIKAAEAIAKLDAYLRDQDVTG